MATYKIPLTNSPQQFQITLGETDYTFVNKWNDALEGGWVLDIYDALTGLPIVMNTPLVTGTDLLQNLAYLNIPGKLIVFTDGDDFAVPTFDNLGIESNLYFQTVD